MLIATLGIVALVGFSLASGTYFLSRVAEKRSDHDTTFVADVLVNELAEYFRSRSLLQLATGPTADYPFCQWINYPEMSPTTGEKEIKYPDPVAAFPPTALPKAISPQRSYILRVVSMVTLNPRVEYCDQPLKNLLTSPISSNDRIVVDIQLEWRTRRGHDRRSITSVISGEAGNGPSDPWPITFGNSDYDDIEKIATYGNKLFAVGFFRYDVTFGWADHAQTITSSPPPKWDLYLMTLEKERLVDVKVFAEQTSFGGYPQPEELKVDASGAVYLCGWFWGAIDFDPGPLEDIHSNRDLQANGNGYVDAFLTKFNPDGSYAWTRTWGKGASCEGVAIDSQGRTFVTGGYFSPNTVFNFTNGGPNEPIVGWTDFYIMMLNSDGTYAWHRTAGSGGSDWGHTIATDANDGVYVAGSFKHFFDLDITPTGEDVRQSYGNKNFAGIDNSKWNSTDIFILKTNARADYVWGRTFGGEFYEYPSSIILGKDGDLYLTGIFYYTVDFDFGVSVDTCTVSGSGGFTDAYLMRMGTDGSYRKTVCWGGSEHDGGGTLTQDASGALYIGGNFGGSVDFDFGPGSQVKSGQSGSNLFVIKAVPLPNSSIQFEWVRTLTSNVMGGYYFGRGSLAAGQNGKIYGGGQFYGDLVFEPLIGGNKQRTSRGDSDAVLFRY